MTTYEGIEWAYKFVNSAPYGMNRAVYDKSSGKIYVESSMLGLSEQNEIPEDLDYNSVIEIPHKKDLGIGRELVFAFVTKFIPEEEDIVRNFFRKPGAYERFKQLLCERNLLDRWHKFQDEAESKAWKDWCKANGINVDEPNKD